MHGNPDSNNNNDDSNADAEGDIDSEFEERKPYPKDPEQSGFNPDPGHKKK